MLESKAVVIGAEFTVASFLKKKYAEISMRRLPKKMILMKLVYRILDVLLKLNSHYSTTISCLLKQFMFI